MIANLQACQDRLLSATALRVRHFQLDGSGEPSYHITWHGCTVPTQGSTGKVAVASRLAMCGLAASSGKRDDWPRTASREYREVAARTFVLRFT